MLFHTLVVLSFGVVAWVNLLEKPYYLCVAFTAAESIAGLIIYATMVRMIRRARNNAYKEAEDQLMAIKRCRSGRAAYAVGDD